MYIVPMERAWKDESNNTKYLKSPKIIYRFISNKVIYFNVTKVYCDQLIIFLCSKSGSS